MNNLIPEVTSLSQFPRFEVKQALQRSRFSDESLPEQDRESFVAARFVADFNRPIAKLDSPGTQLRIVIYQTDVPQVRVNLVEALKGHTGISACLGKWVPSEDRSAQRQIPALESLLQPVTQLEKRGHVDAALDVLYDRIDGLLRARQFVLLDEALAHAEVNLLSTDIIIGLLTATLPAKSKLPSRHRFFADAESSIKARGDWEAGLLAGLES